MCVCLAVHIGGGYWTLKLAHTHRQKHKYGIELTNIHFSSPLCRQLFLLVHAVEVKAFFSFTHTTLTFSPASRVLPAFWISGTNWMWGLTHTGQQMSGSLRLGQLISMTNIALKPPPHSTGGPAFWVAKSRLRVTGDVDFCEGPQWMIVKMLWAWLKGRGVDWCSPSLLEHTH